MLLFKSSWHKALIGTGFSALIIGVLFAPTVAASGGGTSLPKRPNTYALYGDYYNSGVETTIFESTGGDLYGSWWDYASQYNGTGLHGLADSGPQSYGLWGDAVGIGTVGTGAWGLYGGGTGYGLYAYSPNGWAGYFNSPHGWSVVTNNNAWIGSSIYAYRYFYHTLSADGADHAVPLAAATQSTVSDEGSAQVVNGSAVIQIDATYAATVNLSNGYRVFVTPNSADTAGLAVVNKTANSFEVRELNKGRGNFSFDWRIDAVLKGEEARGMDTIKDAPQIDGSLTSRDAPMLNKIQQGQGQLPANK